MANSIVGKLLGSYQDYPAKSEGKQENEFLVAVLVKRFLSRINNLVKSVNSVPGK
jgi:hypothetical protein